MVNELVMDLNELKREFTSRYGENDNELKIFFAPGRVNLIGEHTDYTGGYVLPCALQYGTYLLARPNDDQMIRLASTNQEESTAISCTEPFVKQDVRWFNYPLGVMVECLSRGFTMTGIDLLFSGDIPGGAGLSSSASIEMVTAFALNDILKGDLRVMDMIWISKKAENDFIGVNCGIMDMFAVGMGETKHALFLNCHTLDYKTIPLDIAGYKIVIGNTNKKRGLADSKYNERVAECQLATVYLSQMFDVSRLGEVSYPQFYKVQENIPDELIRRRARHVISENQRVLNAVNCLMKGELRQFGSLMNASHDSLKENYEVTGFELDTMVEEARKIPGVIGARMTGAGFGGCTVSIVKEESVPLFLEKVGANYETITGLTPEFYVAEVGEGVRKLN